MTSKLEKLIQNFEKIGYVQDQFKSEKMTQESQFQKREEKRDEITIKQINQIPVP